MADVLALLRDYHINNKSFQETKEEITFGDFAWPKTTKTNYVICGSGKDGQAKDYYTLETIVHFLKHIDLTHPQYVKLAASAGLTMVRHPDRRDLLAYLKGEKASTTSIDRAAPMDISLRRKITEVSSNISEDNFEPDNKRSRYTDDQDFKNDLKSLIDRDQQQTNTISEAIPLDRLKAIRAKIKANRQLVQTEFDQTDQNQIAASKSAIYKQFSRDLPDDEYLAHFSASVGLPQLISSMDAKSKRTLISSDEKAVKTISARELLWRMRSTILQSQGKTFYDNIVLGILRNVMLKENGPDSNDLAHFNRSTINPTVSIGAPIGLSRVTHQTVPTTLNQAQQGTQMQYSRYDQEKFAARQEDTAGFAIDTMATYHGKGLASMVAGANTDFNNSSIPSDPRSKITRDPRPNIAPGSTPDPYRNVRNQNEARMIARTKSRMARVPIIIIPATPTSLITMLNARDILQEMTFVSTEEKQKSGVKRETEIVIHYKRPDGKSVPYRVIDQPNRLNPDEWDRVVACFVQGQAWQFKGWPIGSDPAVLFTAVKGFNLKYSHVPTDANVAKWNVKVITLDQRKRHLDKAAFQMMWDLIERHLIKSKPHLRGNN